MPVLYDFLLIREADRAMHLGDPSEHEEKLVLGEYEVGKYSYPFIYFTNGNTLHPSDIGTNVNEVMRQMLDSYAKRLVPGLDSKYLDGAFAAKVRAAFNIALNHVTGNLNYVGRAAHIVLGGTCRVFDLIPTSYGLNVIDRESKLEFSFRLDKGNLVYGESEKVFDFAFDKMFSPLAHHYISTKNLMRSVEVYDENNNLRMRDEPDFVGVAVEMTAERALRPTGARIKDLPEPKADSEQWVKVNQGKFNAFPVTPGMYRVKYEEPDGAELCKHSWVPVELIAYWDGERWAADFKQKIVEWYSKCIVERKN